MILILEPDTDRCAQLIESRAGQADAAGFGKRLQTCRDIDPVAVKIMATHLRDNGQLVERFRREAKLIGSLESPHTITLYEFGQTEDGLLYTVMEFARGVSLRPLTLTKSSVLGKSPPGDKGPGAQHKGRQHSQKQRHPRG